MGGSRYGLPISDVLEMATVPRTTPLPNVPEFVRGVANLRGEILAVLDLRMLLDLPPAGDSYRERLLVVKPQGGDATAGLIVDSVRGLARLGEAAIQAPTAPIEDRVAGFLHGVAAHENEILNVLDTARLFSAPEIAALSVS
jgi:purine-binding chemotaxis protein CheW